MHIRGSTRLGYSVRSISMKNITVTALWVGHELPPLMGVCLNSWLRHGHKVELYTYNDLPGVPHGIACKNAADIVPLEEIWVDSNGSLAPFADYFRWTLMERYPETNYIDADALCIADDTQRFGKDDFFAARQADGTLGIGVLRVPKKLAAMMRQTYVKPIPLDGTPRLLHHVDKDVDEQFERVCLSRRLPYPLQRIWAPWGWGGPYTFYNAVHLAGIDADLIVPQETVYPFRWQDALAVLKMPIGLDHDMFKESFSIHLYGEVLRREKVSMRDLIRPGSLAQAILEKYWPAQFTPCKL